MKVALGSDHAGATLRAQIRTWLEERGAQVIDLGTHQYGSVDYPIFAERVAQAVAQGECKQGVLVCGSGIGMSIVANRFQGVRAALCREELSARLARAHNNANVLVLGERFTGKALAEAILQAWWESSFEGGRHQKRVAQIDRVGSRQASAEEPSGS
jgi:ribose 5-phosphate isomerase B